LLAYGWSVQLTVGYAAINLSLSDCMLTWSPCGEICNRYIHWFVTANSAYCRRSSTRNYWWVYTHRGYRVKRNVCFQDTSLASGTDYLSIFVIRLSLAPFHPASTNTLEYNEIEVCSSISLLLQSCPDFLLPHKELLSLRKRVVICGSGSCEGSGSVEQR